MKAHDPACRNWVGHRPRNSRPGRNAAPFPLKPGGWQVRDNDMAESVLRPRAAVILAAGKGERMKSPVPKVLHPVGGRTMLDHAIDTALDLGCERVVVVAGAPPPPGAGHLRGRLGGGGRGTPHPPPPPPPPPPAPRPAPPRVTP